jgi:cytochrome c biogenesis factor
MAMYWTPDVVQNASLLSWLSGAALLHAIVMRDQRGEQRGVQAKSILTMVAVTFLLAVAATAATTVSANGEPASAQRLAQSPIVYSSAVLLLGAAVLFWYLVSSRFSDIADARVMRVAEERRRAGGLMAHVGAIVLCCALCGQLFRTDRVDRVRTGESISAVDALGRTWRFKSLGVSRFEERNRRVLAASFDVSREGQKRELLSSEQHQYIDGQGEPTFEPFQKVAILGSLTQDVYLVFTGSDDADTAAVRISFVPLVWWVWCGGIIMLCGGLIALWPAAQRESVVSDVAMRPAPPAHSPQPSGS